MERKEVNCHLCGGKAELKFEELRLDEGRIIIKASPFFKCKKCGEEFSTSGQMQALSDSINSKFSFSRPLINAGRSLAITIPKDIIENYGLKKGKMIRLVPESKNKIELVIS